MSREKMAFGVLVCALIALSGCTKKEQTTAPAPAKELNVAIWANYLSDETRAQFTKETGITLKVMTYSSNEELLAKVQTGGSGLDIAVPSDYMVDIMTKLNLLEPIEKGQIPNAANISKDVLDQNYDRENKFSLPYSWGTAGLAVNRALYKDPIKSWKDVLENPKLAGKYSLLDDMREVTAAVLKMQGQSVNTTDDKALAKVKEELLKIRKNIKAFNSDVTESLKSREVAVAHAYSPDALQAAALPGDKIDFVIPEEGATRAIDNLVILKGAKDPATARKFIDFVLRKDVNVSFVVSKRSAPVINGVREALPADLKNNTTLFPTPAMFKKLESVTDLGEKNRVYEDIWTAVKTGH